MAIEVTERNDRRSSSDAQAAYTMLREKEDGGTNGVTAAKTVGSEGTAMGKSTVGTSKIAERGTRSGADEAAGMMTGRDRTSTAVPLDTIVREFVRSTAVIRPSHLCEQAVSLFEKHAEAECIVACSDAGEPAGMLMRDKFFRRLSTRFGQSLYYGKPIARLMDSSPMTVDIGVSASELIEQALGRDERSLYDCVILTERGAFAGILTVADLLNISRLLQQQAVQSQIRTIRGAERMMREIDMAVLDVRTSSRKGEELSETMVDLTLKGKNELNGVSQSFASLSMRTIEQEQQIRDLQGRADKISQVSTLIRELADKCNLLAVNATIEAARAGEHGKGFAVVADEVRQLASQTKQSADDITKMIKSIIESVTMTAQLVQTGREESLAGEASVSRAVGAFEQLFHAAADNRNSAREIGELSAQAYDRSARVAAEINRLIEEMQK